MIVFDKTQELDLRVKKAQELARRFEQEFPAFDTKMLLWHIGNAGVLLERLPKMGEYGILYAPVVRSVERDLDEADKICVTFYIQSSKEELREKAVRLLAEGDVKCFDQLSKGVDALFSEGDSMGAILVLVQMKSALKGGNPQERMERLGRIRLKPEVRPTPVHIHGER